MKETVGKKRTGWEERERIWTLILSSRLTLDKVLFFFHQGLQERKGKLPKIFLEQSEGGKREGETWRAREEKQKSSEWFSMKLES